MKFKRFEWALAVRIALLLAMMSAIAFLIMKQNVTSVGTAGIAARGLIFQVFDLYR